MGMASVWQEDPCLMFTCAKLAGKQGSPKTIAFLILFSTE
jgi:hypothetical protein